MEQLSAHEAPVARASGRRLVVVSLGLGAVLAYVWSFHLADDLIGTNGTSVLVGYDAGKATLTGAVEAAIFALASGFAGSFTACNVAAFGVLGPLAGTTNRGRFSIRDGLTRIGWLFVGAVAVAGQVLCARMFGTVLGRVAPLRTMASGFAPEHGRLPNSPPGAVPCFRPVPPP
jgi:hypothetical protein